jgi:hypothetical protein
MLVVEWTRNGQFMDEVSDDEIPMKRMRKTPCILGEIKNF